MEDITVAFVIIAGCAGLGHQIWHIVRGDVPAKWRSETEHKDQLVQIAPKKSCQFDFEKLIYEVWARWSCLVNTECQFTFLSLYLQVCPITHHLPLYLQVGIFIFFPYTSRLCPIPLISPVPKSMSHHPLAPMSLQGMSLTPSFPPCTYRYVPHSLIFPIVPAGWSLSWQLAAEFT